MQGILMSAAVTIAAVCGGALAQDDGGTPAQGGAVLRVEVRNLEPKGEVAIGVYRGADNYDASERAYGLRHPVDGESVIIVFEDVEPGEYAIKLYHDVNGNREHDRNFVGIPKEPYAFSNNARGNMSAASYEDAKFQVAVGENDHSITLE